MLFRSAPFSAKNVLFLRVDSRESICANDQNSARRLWRSRKRKSRSVPEGGADFPEAFSLPENAKTLAGMAFHAAGKSVKNLPAASKFAGKLFQQGISDSHSLLEFSEMTQSPRFALRIARPSKSLMTRLTCFHASFFPFCPLFWPPLFLPLSRHLFTPFFPSKNALLCRAKGTAQHFKNGSFRTDLSTKFGKEIPSRNLREKRSVEGIKKQLKEPIRTGSPGWDNPISKMLICFLFISCFFEGMNQAPKKGININNFARSPPS